MLVNVRNFSLLMNFLKTLTKMFSSKRLTYKGKIFILLWKTYILKPK